MTSTAWTSVKSRHTFAGPSEPWLMRLELMRLPTTCQLPTDHGRLSLVHQHARGDVMFGMDPIADLDITPMPEKCELWAGPKMLVDVTSGNAIVIEIAFAPGAVAQSQ